MRMFFLTVGVLAWLFALAVLWIFAESGGALAVIAAGVFAGVAILALGLDRVLKRLEEIRDRTIVQDVTTTPRTIEKPTPTAHPPVGPIPA